MPSESSPSASLAGDLDRTEDPTDSPRPRAGGRFGLALLLTLAVLLLIVGAPDARLSRTLTALLVGFLLVLSVLSAGLGTIKRTGLLAVTVAAIAGLGIAALGPTAPLPSRLAMTALVAVITVLLARGVLRLVRSSGVNLRAVLGALTVYLLMGLLWAFAYGVAAEIEPRPLFGSNGDGTPSEYVYFSFTALTTTGFGNLAVATALGRAVATLEMVVGQLYLVTVVAVMVASLPAARRRGA